MLVKFLSELVAYSSAPPLALYHARITMACEEHSQGQPCTSFFGGKTLSHVAVGQKDTVHESVPVEIAAFIGAVGLKQVDFPSLPKFPM